MIKKQLNEHKRRHRYLFKEKANASRLAEECCFTNSGIQKTGALWIQGHFMKLKD